MIKAKKSLGQNFLVDENIINKIINVIDISSKVILEVGPGTGNLTNKILKKNPNSFLAIEKDNNLAKELKKRFHNKVDIISAPNFITPPIVGVPLFMSICQDGPSSLIGCPAF